MRVKLYNQKEEWVGDYDTGDQTYWTQRDAGAGQLFYKFGNAIALDVFILKQILKRGGKWIAIQIVGFEEKSFYAISSVHSFIMYSDEINYDKRNRFGENYTGYGTQRRMPMNNWKRAYTLEEVHKIRNEEQALLDQFFNSSKP